jgi:molybdopterin synthase sulfur carrier subunit
VPVEVRVPTMMRADTGGQATIAVDGTTIGEVLDDIVARHPGLAGKLRANDGGLHKFVNVYVNDDDVRYLDKLDTKVGDGDVVSILPAVAGG